MAAPTASAPTRRDVVVIGASAGGVTALRALLARIPPRFGGTLFVVQHRSPMLASHLARVLRGTTDHVLEEPADGDRVRRGAVFLAPRDRHLMLDGRRMRVTRGPKEHFTRPAVDPLFRSAAGAYGPRVAGVLLTGCGYDGYAGLIAIKEAGGVSLVQDPHEAEFDAMPRQAIRKDFPDLVLPLGDLAAMIVALMEEPSDLRGASP